VVGKLFRAKSNGANGTNGTKALPGLRLVRGKASQRDRGILARRSDRSGDVGLLGRLKAENAELRNKAADLALQIQELRDVEAQL
jgi:hypothetical protein